MKSFIALTLILLAVIPAYAVGPGFTGTVDDGCLVPLDGGLSLLAAAGVGYGVKKFMDLRKKTSTEA